ncbi:MAG: DUF1669 domain-containing protein [Leptospiraceae bacterium]|nr:DUF1669 domain-containing protein [Leptospiraceae bacterium]
MHSRILDLINHARNSILILAYGLEDPQLIDALVDARQRGVHIRTVLSPEKEYPGLEGTGIPREVRNASGLQHVKALLIDHSMLVSGTGNFTRSGMFYNNNAFLFLRMPTNRGKELERKLIEPDPDRPFMRLPGITLVLSPEGGDLIQSILARNITRARYSIRFLMFRFTDPVLSTLIYFRARNGVPVEGILDGNGYSLPGRSALEDPYYESGNMPLQLFLDGNQNRYQSSDGIYHGGHLHHKSAVIDGKLFTGSYNWSMSARDRNREIFFIIERPRIVEAFQAEFRRLKYRARIMPRPPADNPGRLPESRQGELCFRTGNQAVVTGGRKALFHAIRFEATTSSLPCKAEERSSYATNHSAGASRGRDYYPGFAEQIIGPGGNSRLQANEQKYAALCAAEPCEAASIERMNPEAGWMTVEGNSSYDALIALGRHGWHRRELERTGQFYRFSSLPEQDLLLFLKSPTETRLACMTMGSRDPEIQRYMQFFRFYRSAIQCLEGER